MDAGWSSWEVVHSAGLLLCLCCEDSGLLSALSPARSEVFPYTCISPEDELLRDVFTLAVTENCWNRLTPGLKGIRSFVIAIKGGTDQQGNVGDCQGKKM